jgi:hypothetical protein
MEDFDRFWELNSPWNSHELIKKLVFIENVTFCYIVVSTRSRISTLLFGRHKSSFLAPKRASGVVRDEIYGPVYKKKLLQKSAVWVWQKHITKLLTSRYKIIKIKSEKRQNTGKMDLKKCQKRVPPPLSIKSCFLYFHLWFEHFGDEKYFFS